MSGVSDRVASLAKTFERRVADPIVRRLLRSRFHPLASQRVVLIEYESQVSGRQYDIPVAYARHDRSILAATPAQATNWWQNFREPTPCTLFLRGRPRAAMGEVVTEPSTRESLARIYTPGHDSFITRVPVGVSKRVHPASLSTKPLTGP